MTKELVRTLGDASKLPSRVRGRRASMTSLTAPGTSGRPIPTISREVPAADFPPLPTVSLGAFLPAEAPTIRSVQEAGEVVHVTAGRYAIALALKAMGIGKGEKVLVPAYHCMTMVEPLRYTAAQPVFYRLKDGLSPDFEDIASKIEPDSRVLMVTHYFGFPQDMVKVRNFCDTHGLRLLEDCAHAYFGEVAGRPVGAFGDFAIASPTKFFPLYDGGCLICKNGGVYETGIRRQDALASIAAAIGEIKRADYYGNLPVISPLLSLARSVRDLWRQGQGAAWPKRRERAALEAEESAQMAMRGSRDFDPSRVNVAMSGYSSWIYRHVARSRIIAKRRQNYLLLIKELEGLDACRPFLPELPEGVVPYEVPFWIDDLSRHFLRLEDMAVPMHRFGQFLHPAMAEGICPLSESLSHHLVQFPCHQDLSASDIAQIATRIRLALSG